MAWTYDNTLPSAKDQVRYLIQDTDTAEQLAQDEEISFALSQNGQNVYGAAADCCNALSLGFARRFSFNDKLIDDNKARAEKYAEMAKDFRAQAKTKRVPNIFAGGLSKSEKQARASDTDAVQPSFTVDLHSARGGNSSLSDC
jgi:hypothetical protein